MKHSTFRKSSLISSVALLLVAIVALSGATFAWFSSKASADATGIQAQTKQGSQLVISKIATGDWTQNLDLAAASNLDMKPVTTNDLSAFYTASAESFDTQKPVANSDGDLYTKAAASSYIKQTIYVKYAAAQGTFDLKADLAVTEPENSSAKNYDFYRVAIVPVAGTEENELGTVANGETYIYSVKAKNHAEYTDGEGQKVDPTYGNYDVNTASSDIELGTITAGSVYAYDVYIWFEGEDLDCVDSNSTNDLTLDIEFK